MTTKCEELFKDRMNNKYVDMYISHLRHKKVSLGLKRAFDIVVSIIMLVILSPLFLILAVMIKVDSKGPVIFKQTRVTKYGRDFKIWKFRTMVNNAEALGTQVTTNCDMRVTRVGKKIRKCRLDEIPQLVNILKGDMTFVGTRPEVPKYVNEYTDEMFSTLLMRAGVTSLASIEFKDEDKMLADTNDADRTYIDEILPLKMKYNLKYISEFSFVKDIGIMFKTIIAVIK